MSAPSNDSADFFQSEASRALLKELDRSRVPQHVAIIMDGNGRWATARKLPRIAGHRAGASAVRETIMAAIELGVRYLTIYSFSSENWARPTEEVKGLMTLFVEVLERELESLQKMDVRVRLIGRRDDLPQKTRSAFEDAERATGENTTLDLVVAINYGGRSEIVDAVRTLTADVRSGAVDPGDVGEDDIASRLYTAEVPDPDLLIRTSGEMRVSNFLLWQIAYSELWVTDTLWPDFDRDEFLLALSDYQQRQRRFGA